MKLMLSVGQYLPSFERCRYLLAVSQVHRAVLQDDRAAFLVLEPSHVHSSVSLGYLHPLALVRAGVGGSHG